MTYEDAPSGGIGVMRETVEIDMGPEHLAGLETIVDPVVVSELADRAVVPRTVTTMRSARCGG